MSKSQILTLNEAKKQRAEWQKNNHKVVFTNGCFDILHAGHVTYLNEAKSLGDKLIIGLNSDQSVQILKGKSRPIIKEEHRAMLLEALEIVDMVVIFEESTPIELITYLKPDIHVKGGDYKAEKLPEYPIVKSYGGDIVILSFVDGCSTTDIINKINSAT